MNTNELDVKVDEQKIQNVIETYDSESRYRQFEKGSTFAFVVLVIGVTMSLFHLYTAGFGLLEAIKQRAIHLNFVLVLIFLLYPASKKSSNKVTTIDLLCIVGSILSLTYIVFQWDAIALRGGSPTTVDLTMGFICSILVLEAARRTVGYILPLLSILFLAYACFGQYVPGVFNHQGSSLQRIIWHMYIGTEGIFGIALDASATFVFVFILFGALMGQTGMSRLINDVSLAIAGKYAGGPAKVAVLASAIMGSVNGSAVANVATTGAFTIPLMKKVGYKSHYAGAVEAAASTGGQIMPPVMGAAAFIMAGMLGISYKVIMLAGIIPAILYFIAIFTMVHLEAKKLGLSGLPKTILPNLWDAIKARGHMGLSLIILVYLIIKGYSPFYAAFYSIVSIVLLSFIRPETRLTFKTFILSLEAGAKSALSVAISCAVVGFIIGVASLTSFGIVFGHNIMTLAQGSTFFALVLAMIACMILGMGLPTAASYIIGAIIVAPALVGLGFNTLAVHFFVLYYACLSAVTPPVALASYAASGLSGAPPGKTGWTALNLALAGFILPFNFLYEPMLLLSGDVIIPTLIIKIITALIGVILLGAGVQAFLLTELNLFERTITLVSSICLIGTGVSTDIIGLILLLILSISQVYKFRNHQSNVFIRLKKVFIYKRGENNDLNN